VEKDHSKGRSVRVDMVHLQLTTRCNLDCWFCGQRKWRTADGVCRKDGMRREMTEEQWLRVADDIIRTGAMQHHMPSVMIWGGEAELSDSFPAVLQHLHDHGVSVGMVTNGTLMDRYASLIDRCVDKLYLSVDGTPEIHDCIRGKGTFGKIRDNLTLLRSGKIQRVIMTVITDEVAEHLDEVLDSYCSLRPNLIIFQDMIGLSKEEVVRYQEWSREVFNQDAPMIGSWAEARQEQVNRRRRAVKVVSFLAKKACRNDRSERYPFEIQYLPHRSTLSCFLPHEIEALYRINGVDNVALPAAESHACGNHVNLVCTSAWHHLHVGWNGEVSFCTDFTDISMGNIMESTLLQIMNGEKAERFRKEIESGNCVCCRHCSWCYKKDYTRL